MSLEPTSNRNICTEMPGSENFIPQVLKKTISYQKFEDKDRYPTSTKFLTEVLKVIRVVYRYEEEYSGTQLEYNNLFELIMSLVDNSILTDENAFGFDPEFYKRAWEIIKLELGTNLRLIEELLSFLEKVLVKNLRVYYDNDGNRKEMDGAYYLKGVGQIIDVLRGLFGEGSKNQNVQLIPTIARMVADHPFWGELQKFSKKEHQQLVHTWMDLFSDMIFELPENIAGTTLNGFVDRGIIFHFLEFFLEHTPEDYDLLSG
jgi:hypothetical protein